MTQQETMEIIEIEPGEVPPHWQNIPFRVLKHAITFGLVIPEYTLRNPGTFQTRHPVVQ